MRYAIKLCMCFVLKSILCVSNAKFVERNFLKRASTIESKIIGGSAVPIDQFPSAAQFFNLGSFCAGTVLNSWTVMTAAHCFDLNKDVQNMMVHVVKGNYPLPRYAELETKAIQYTKPSLNFCFLMRDFCPAVGSLCVEDINKKQDKLSIATTTIAGTTHLYDHRAKVHEVDSIVIHEDYNNPIPFACDIALIFLETPIEFNNKTKKGILVNTRKWMSSKEKDFKVTGWGWTRYGGPVSKIGLMMAVLRYVPLKKCGRMHNLELSSDMFCLYGDELKDTCRGDSGGSVLWNKMVVGIISHGDGCAKKGKPSVYTNVLYFRDWIKSEVERYISEYCFHVKNYKRT